MLASARPPTVAIAADLGVALAQDDQQALYLRTFFRLLYQLGAPTHVFGSARCVTLRLRREGDTEAICDDPDLTIPDPLRASNAETRTFPEKEGAMSKVTADISRSLDSCVTEPNPGD